MDTDVTASKLLRQIMTAACLLLVFNPTLGQVYKYQDANGKWHFSDKPPENQKGSVIGTATSSAPSTGDLKQKLLDTYKPQSRVDEASLSVVTVKTKTGSGSGFFVTRDGYIVTNRHVVRPASSSQARDTRAELAERKQNLDDYKQDLADEKEQLGEMKLWIEEERDYIESKRATKTHKKQYKRYVARYEKNKKNYEDHLRKYKKLLSAYNKDKSEFGFSSSLSNFSKKFTIQLKDGRNLKARLVRISKDYDLALLKLDAFNTPHLSLSGNGRPRQGTQVFAIGSPLGITDSLTAGIVTKLSSDHLYTDTQILPGNSGGPLVNEQGQVLGVNTAVLSQQDNLDGLGLAIYAHHIRSEFSKELKGRF